MIKFCCSECLNKNTLSLYLYILYHFIPPQIHVCINIYIFYRTEKCCRLPSVDNIPLIHSCSVYTRNNLTFYFTYTKVTHLYTYKN